MNRIAVLLFVMMFSMFGFVHTSTASDKVNINTASVQELQSVKGIGEKTAQAIVKYRKKHGAFSSVAELKHVKGIGEKKLSKMQKALTVGKASSKPKKKDKKKQEEGSKNK